MAGWTAPCTANWTVTFFFFFNFYGYWETVVKLSACEPATPRHCLAFVCLWYGGMWCGWRYRPGGRRDAQRDAAFSSAVYQLSRHTAPQTHSVCCGGVTHRGSSCGKFTSSLEGVVCLCVCWRENIFLRIWLVCGFHSLQLTFLCIFLYRMWRCGCFRLGWVVPLHVCLSHSCWKKLIKQLACRVAPSCVCVSLMSDSCVYEAVSLFASAVLNISP